MGPRDYFRYLENKNRWNNCFPLSFFEFKGINIGNYINRVTRQNCITTETISSVASFKGKQIQSDYKLNINYFSNNNLNKPLYGAMVTSEKVNPQTIDSSDIAQIGETCISINVYVATDYFIDPNNPKKPPISVGFSPDEEENIPTGYVRGVALINNFDPKGRPHSNNETFYRDLPPDEKAMYIKYYTNEAFTPHFHFNSGMYSKSSGRPNAISASNVLRYLTDLEKAVTTPNESENDVSLLTYDLGMPFLDVAQGRIQYTSTMAQIFEKVKSSQSLSVAELEDVYKEFLFKKQDAEQSGLPASKSGLHALITDLETLTKVIETTDNPDIITIFSEGFMESLISSESLQKTLSSKQLNDDFQPTETLISPDDLQDPCQ